MSINHWHWLLMYLHTCIYLTHVLPRNKENTTGINILVKGNLTGKPHATEEQKFFGTKVVTNFLRTHHLVILHKCVDGFITIR